MLLPGSNIIFSSLSCNSFSIIFKRSFGEGKLESVYDRYKNLLISPNFVTKNDIDERDRGDMFFTDKTIYLTFINYCNLDNKLEIPFNYNSNPPDFDFSNISNRNILEKHVPEASNIYKDYQKIKL